MVDRQKLSPRSGVGPLSFFTSDSTPFSKMETPIVPGRNGETDDMESQGFAAAASIWHKHEYKYKYSSSANR